MVGVSRLVFCVCLAWYASAALAADDKVGWSPYVDAQGNITRPTEVRTHWEHLGSWYVADIDGAAGPGFHDVYASPGARAAYEATGKFPDSTVLVKEVRAIESRVLTTGKAHWAGDVGVWFVMIRDTQQRFPDNPAWGEGWGWALFMADAPEVNVNRNWQEGGLDNCYACHLPVRDSEWVFTEGYPGLR